MRRAPLGAAQACAERAFPLVLCLTEQTIGPVRQPVQVRLVPVHLIANQHLFCRVEVHFTLSFWFNSLKRYCGCIFYVYTLHRYISRPKDFGVNKKSEKKKAGKKDSQLVLRLDKEERDAFVELCQSQPRLEDQDPSGKAHARGDNR